MKQIETQIRINATPEQVWEVLMDFDRYEKWNPMIPSIKGEARIGARFSAVLHMPGMKHMNFRPRILVLRPAREFRWLGRLFLPRIFDGEHYFQLQPQPDGSTLLIHGEKFKGILVSLILKKVKAATLEGFRLMNEALKERVEGRQVSTGKPQKEAKDLVRSQGR